MRWGAGVLFAAGVVALATPSVAARTGSSAVPAPCVELSDEVLAGQVLLALVDAPSEASALVREGAVAGMAPSGRVSASEAAELVDLRAADVPYGVLVAADEEGGRVQRFADVVGALPSAAEMARTMTPDEVEAMFADHGRKLRAAGVDVAFAPVVDVGAGPAIGDRSFGDDPAVVTAYGAAVVEGYQAAGVMPVLKHFPGHGRASADTHDGAAGVPPLDELRAVDLVPFEALVDGDGPLGVMVGHLEVPGLTDGVPASLSSAAIDGLLRGELGFEGLVVSDALGMGAIAQRYSGGDAAVRFLVAGGDLAIVSVADAPAARSAIVAALQDGRLDRARLQASVDRVMAAKHLDPCTLRAAVPTTTSVPPTTTTPPTTEAPATSAPATSPPATSAPQPEPGQGGDRSWAVVAVIAAVGLGALASVLAILRRRHTPGRG